MNIPRLRTNILLLAEAFDAWRVIVHLMLMAYGYLVISLYIWYRNIPTYVQEKCDGSIITALMDKGKNMAEIKQYACTVVDVVGGPTAAQSTFVTTIIGLSAGIFGLYTATGRKWDGWEPNFSQKSGPAMVSYAPSSITTADGEVLPVGPSVQRNKPSIQIFAAGEGEAEGEALPESDGPKP